MILIEMEQDTDQNSYEIKSRLYLLCASIRSMTLMVLLLERLLSSCRESLLHLYSVLLLLPWPPGAHGLQSTIFS